MVTLLTLTWTEEAASERVTGETWLAGANGTVVHYSACALLTARVRAGIDALVASAREIQRTVGANGALWFAIGRCSGVSW